MAEPTRQLTGLRRVAPADTELLGALFAALPDRDRSFLQGRTEPEVIARWDFDDGGSRWLVEDDGAAQAFLSVIPHQGWSSHVGALRLVVAAGYRRRGIGRALARHGLLEGIALELKKITVDVAADRDGDIAMFTSLGFRPEALLEDQISDWNGDLHDLVVLAHDVARVRDDLELVGVDTALGLRGGD
jgi:ribosomal protein S18 acetylase RimI-like enzyme